MPQGGDHLSLADIAAAMPRLLDRPARERRTGRQELMRAPAPRRPTALAGPASGPGICRYSRSATFAGMLQSPGRCARDWHRRVIDEAGVEITLLRIGREGGCGWHPRRKWHCRWRVWLPARWTGIPRPSEPHSMKHPRRSVLPPARVAG